jgi:enterochelin esterase family protein
MFRPRVVSLSALITVALHAQTPAPPGQGKGRGRGLGRGPVDTLVSPEVHPDRTVTFRLRAPQANEVTLTGDWMATLDASTGGMTKMTKDASGIWSFASPPLEPTVHLYFFTVDGMTIADPVNPDVKLRVRTSGSLVEVPAIPCPSGNCRMSPAVPST